MRQIFRLLSQNSKHFMVEFCTAKEGKSLKSIPEDGCNVARRFIPYLNLGGL